jgi:hypothetical protein
MPNMYGTVAVVRDQPNSASMGLRNSQKQTERIHADGCYRDDAGAQQQNYVAGPWHVGAARSSRLCQINAEITTEWRGKICRAAAGRHSLTFRIPEAWKSARRHDRKRREIENSFPNALETMLRDLTDHELRD